MKIHYKNVKDNSINYIDKAIKHKVVQFEIWNTIKFIQSTLTTVRKCTLY